MKTDVKALSPSPSPVLIEGGIAKFPAGRLPEDARKVADEAWKMQPSDRVVKIHTGTTLAEVNAMPFAPGTTVLFERGGIWRGQLRTRSGTPDHPIRYGAWGKGADPVIQPSIDASNALSWTRVGCGNDVWYFNLPTAVDCGNVILDGGDSGCLRKRGSSGELIADMDFYFDPDARRLSVRSSGGNPAKRWQALEIAQKLNCIDQPCAHDVIYENLHVRYGAAHGFGGGSTARISIRNCSVEWIGGGYLYRDDFGNGVRYGNGIEFWGTAEDILVEHCTVRQCWDAGITNQTNEPGSVQRRIVWRDCDVSACEYSYEFWHQGEGGTAQDIVLTGNRFTQAGSGWGHSQRWNPNAAHLMLYDTTLATPGFIIENNVFDRSENVIARIFNEGWPHEASFHANTWLSTGEPLCRCHRRPRSGLVHLYPDRLDRTHDDNAAEIESQGKGGIVYSADGDGPARFTADFNLRNDSIERK